MLTKSEWNDVRVGLKFLTSTCMTPYDWDEKRSLLRPTKSKAKICTSGIGLLATTSYSLFVILRIPNTFSREGSNMGDVALHLLCSLWYTSMAIWQYTVGFACRNEFAETFNQQEFFNFTQGIKHLGIRFERPMKRSSSFHLGGFLTLGITVVWACIFYNMRHQCFFVYSSFPEDWKIAPVIVLMTLAEATFSCTWLTAWYCLFFTQYTYLIGTKFWLNILCITWPKAQVLPQCCLQNMRTPNMQTTFCLYRSVELINTMFNNRFATLIIPELLVMSISATALTSYAVIKYGSEMHTVTWLMLSSCVCFFAASLFFVCMVGAHFHQNTKEFHANCKRVMGGLALEEQKYYRRLAKACQPFGFRVGSFYVVKKLTIATVMDATLNLLVTLLLTY